MIRESRAFQLEGVRTFATRYCCYYGTTTLWMHLINSGASVPGFRMLWTETGLRLLVVGSARRENPDILNLLLDFGPEDELEEQLGGG